MRDERSREALARAAADEEELEDFGAATPDVEPAPASSAASDSKVIVRSKPAPEAETAKPKLVHGSRRWLFIAKHYAWTSVRSWRWWLQVVLLLMQIGILLQPIWALGVKSYGFSFVAFIGITIAKRWKDTAPQNRKVVARNYDERKLRMYTLVHAIQQHELMTGPEIVQFQRDTLELIAAYVRDHRLDWSSKPTIFANLLVEDGADLVVVARDSEHRSTPARYPKDKMLAWTALTTGEAAVTGDVCRDFPETSRDRSYRSILAVPVHRDGQVVGVVSIDSSQPFHFDLSAAELDTHLKPYVALLAWTLQKRAQALYLPGGLVG